MSPIAYTYNEEDERQKAIIDSLKEACKGCIDNMDDSAIWNFAYNVIRRLSSITCWAELPDDTLITQKRTQQVKIDWDYCKCFGCVAVVPLEYLPLAEDEQFISAKFIVVEGAKVQTINIENPEQYYHEDLAEWRFDLNQELTTDQGETYNICSQCKCCEPEVYLTLEYNAGYDTIPGALMPTICRLLYMAIFLQNQCQNEANYCRKLTAVAANAYLKSKTQGDVRYEWTTNEDDVTRLYNALYAAGEFAEIQSISRCIITRWAGTVV